MLGISRKVANGSEARAGYDKFRDHIHVFLDLARLEAAV